MADSGAVRAGQAFVELLTNDSKLVKGLADAQRKFRAWGAPSVRWENRCSALAWPSAVLWPPRLNYSPKWERR